MSQSQRSSGSIIRPPRGKRPLEKAEFAVRQYPSLEVSAQVGGLPATLYLDTGAGRTGFDQASAQRLELRTRCTDDRAWGLGVGDQPVSYAAMKEFCIGSCSLPAIELRHSPPSAFGGRTMANGGQKCTLPPGIKNPGKLANSGLSQNHHFWECAAGQLRGEQLE